MPRILPLKARKTGVCLRFFCVWSGRYFMQEKKIMLAEFAVLAYVARRLFFYSKRELICVIQTV